MNSTKKEGLCFMVDERLVDYIQEVVKKGGTVKEAKKKLISAGYKTKLIDETASKIWHKKFEKIALTVLVIIVIISVLGIIIKDIELVEDDEEPFVSEMDLLRESILTGNLSQCDQFNVVKKQICIENIQDNS